MTRVLVTTTSFQDTPGPHHEKLESQGWEILRQRGPLPEAKMLELVGEIDAMICGDDALTRKVLEKARPRLRILSKYGIGVDKIDVKAATGMGIPVLFTPGVNHTTVAEHVFALLLALQKNLVEEANHTAAGRWTRLTGHEILGKTMAIVGLGRIGKETALRAKAFGLTVKAYDVYWDEAFAAQHGIERVHDLDDLLPQADIISLHTNLTPETEGLMNAARFATLKEGAVLLNCARGELVVTADVKAALESGKLGGYGTDVLDQEPPPADHPLLSAPRCLVTPHIGSRTYESVQRQAGMAVENLLLAMSGQKPLAQVNDVPIPSA